jgi:methionyl-tRNA synthetase
MLKQLGLRLPSKIYSHGWVLMKGGKMSKSVGNVVYPGYLINKYGVDTLRYYMTKIVPFGQDGTFTPEMFIENINTDLVNNIGNLLSRTVAMIIKYFDGVVPSIDGSCINEYDTKLTSAINNLVDKFESNMDEMKLTEGITNIFEIGDYANEYNL